MRAKLILFAMLLAAVLPARAEQGDDVIHLGIERSSVPRVRVRLLPLETATVWPDGDNTLVRMAGRLARDLHYSGLIEIVAPLPPGVRAPVIRDQSTDSPPPAPEYALRLRLEDDAEGRRVWDARLFEPDSTLMMGRRYTLGEQNPMRSVHHYADEVVTQLTGEPGIAQTRVLFSRGAGDRREIYVVDFDGENLREVTRNERLNLMPRWSPDGQHIAFTTYFRGRQRLMLLDAGTGRSRQVSDFAGLNLGAAWSPDGAELAVTLSRDGNSEIYRLGLDGEIEQRLSFEASIECSPVWDPSGHQIAFTSDRTGSPQIYVMDRVGTGRRRVTFEGSYNDSAAWSPLGDRIAYVSRVDGRFTIFVVAPDGSDLQRVTFPRDGDNEDPSWAPDGRHLVVSSNRTGYTNLWVLDVESGEARQLTRGEGQDTGPSWGPAPTTQNDEDSP